MQRRIAAIASVLMSLAVLPGTAHAVTRLASSAGGAAPPCTATPCDLQSALDSADPGDTVSIAGGTYTFASAVSASDSNLDIVGESGGSKPLLRFNGTFPGVGFAFALGVTSGKLRNLAIEAPNGTTAIGVDFTAQPAITLSRVDVTASGACAQLFGRATVEDSTFHQTGASPSGFGCLSVFAFSGNSTVRDVEVSSTSTLPAGTPAASFTGAGITVDRLVATGTSNPGLGVAISGNAPPASPSVMRRSRISGFATGLNAGANVLVSDTVVNAPASTPPNAAVQAGGATLRNVTAVASGSGARGLQILATAQPAPFNITSVKNSVFRGDAADVVIDPGTPGGLNPPGCMIGIDLFCIILPATSPGDLTIDHSNFRTVSGGTLNAASGVNQSADPKFADAAAGDFHPLSGSPLIDAGVDDPANGPLDFDGKARKLGAAVDIGAFESDPPPPQQPVQVDRTAPRLTAIGITNKTFAVGSGPTVVNARAKRGTTFVYTLSEPATVAISIQRAQPGRRKGRNCVKPTKKNRKARKCTRFVTMAKLTRSGARGVNAVPFSGRIGTKALKPGKYRATFAARDAAGNLSTKSPSVGFTIVTR
jgi:hypothetical protein